METDYTPFSREPFAGDPLIGQEIAKLCQQYGVKTIIETGTQSGSTARELAKLAPLATIELDPKWFWPVSKVLRAPNVATFLGESDFWLDDMDRWTEGAILVYLDAHDMDGSPVKAELAVLSTWQHPPIVVVHDCKVPDKDFGYDIYNDGTELTYEYFKDAIGWSHTVYYNAQAEGARRGVCYIIPTQLKGTNENQENEKT